LVDREAAILLAANGIIRTTKQLPEVSRTAVWGRVALCLAGASCGWWGGNIEKLIIPGCRIHKISASGSGCSGCMAPSGIIPGYSLQMPDIQLLMLSIWSGRVATERRTCMSCRLMWWKGPGKGTVTCALLWMRSMILRPGCRGQRRGRYWCMWGWSDVMG